VYHAGLGTQAEGQNRPGDERRESQQESGEHDVSLGGVSVDPKTARSYFIPEWAVAGSHVIEPTGPMMGPHAVADVTPPGGRQTSR
jgi:hypothetical protein